MSARDTKEDMDSMETSLRSGGGHPNNTSDEMNRELECLMADFKMEDESILTTPRAELYCPKSWDRLLCWPETSAGDLALLPCFDELQGIKYDTTQNATRMCHANGSWDSYTDYNSCNNMHLMSVEQGIEAVTTTTLTTLYFVGYSISLVAISIAIYIFIYFKDLRCLRNTIHTNLMSTYLVAEFVWILTSTLQIYMQPNTASCVVLIIVLGYFHLTNFFWMFVEGLYLYMLVVETFSGENIKLRVYVVIGWGAPAVFIVIWAIVKSVVPAIATSETQVPNPDHLLRECPWMRPHTCDWIYQAPVIAVLAVNSVFLAMIMWVLITKLRSANTVETQQYRKATKALLVLIPLLGITYILMIQGPTEGESANIFAYVRAVMISTQGFTVALFYCFLNTEVQNTVRHHLDRWKTERSIGGSRRYNYSSKDWSPRSRTESIRMYNQNNKRESTVSETTTTTLVGGTSTNNDTNGSAAAMFTCGETMNTTTALLTAENAV